MEVNQFKLLLRPKNTLTSFHLDGEKETQKSERVTAQKGSLSHLSSLSLYGLETIYVAYNMCLVLVSWLTENDVGYIVSPVFKQ